MPKRVTKKIGEYASHKYLNNGIGIILSRNENRTTIKFEDEKVGTYPSTSVVELSNHGALRVRVNVTNLRICNRLIKRMKMEKAPGNSQKDGWDVLRVDIFLKRMKVIAQKEHDYLKETFGIVYAIED